MERGQNRPPPHTLITLTPSDCHFLSYYNYRAVQCWVGLDIQKPVKKVMVGERQANTNNDLYIKSNLGVTIQIEISFYLKILLSIYT